MAKWFVVMLAGEYAEASDLFGPYRSEDAARVVADRWNAEHPNDPARVLPIQAACEMKEA